MAAPHGALLGLRFSEEVDWVASTCSRSFAVLVLPRSRRSRSRLHWCWHIGVFRIAGDMGTRRRRVHLANLIVRSCGYHCACRRAGALRGRNKCSSGGESSPIVSLSAARRRHSFFIGNGSKGSQNPKIFLASRGETSQASEARQISRDLRHYPR